MKKKNAWIIKKLLIKISIFIFFVFAKSPAEDSLPSSTFNIENKESFDLKSLSNDQNRTEDSLFVEEKNLPEEFFFAEDEKKKLPKLELETSNSDVAKNLSKELVNLELQSRTLNDLILALAELKKINILIPPSLEAEKVIINFSLKDKIPVEEVEEYLLYFLSMAGYILILQDNFFVVTKKSLDENLRRDNLPLYVNITPEELPDNAAYIRVIHILKHVKVPTPQGIGSDAIKKILLEMLPEGGLSVLVDVRTNALILTGPSNAIASVLLILNQIDTYGEPDYVYFLPIEYAQAGYVHKLMESILSISKNDISQGTASVISYFSPHIKIVLDGKQNALIIFGEKEAVEKIINFIKSEIDIPEKEGKGLVHIYNLQYLDSKKIAPILQELVNGVSEKDQSNKENVTSLYRKFDAVRIIPEENIHIKRANGDETKLSLGSGNKLIISATESDFIELSKIIATLDQPQPQIIIEIIIFDLHLSDIKNYSSDSRSPSFFNLPFSAAMQSIMMDQSQVILQNPGGAHAINAITEVTPLTSMKSNLLASIESPDGGNGVTSLINTAPRNGLIISLGENNPNKSIWSLLQLEQFITKRHVIENPTVITGNNVPAKIVNVVVKRGAGELSPNNTQYGGATVVNIQSYTAALAVSVTPRISFGNFNTEQPLRLNLEINMNIEDFKNDAFSDYTKYSRALKTNANITSGDILVLGGLTKETSSEQIYGVPILKDIPIIGSLFTKKVKQKDYADLYICIRATVIDSSEELERYTSTQTNHYKSENCENILSAFVDQYTTVKL